jgi:hypothetical protein
MKTQKNVFHHAKIESSKKNPSKKEETKNPFQNVYYNSIIN